MKRLAMTMVLLLALATALTGFAFAEETTGAEDYEEYFTQWNADAPALNALIDYVEDVTDLESPNFIEKADRIAVFDMDGTLMGELYPTYLEYYMLAWRILKDPDCQPDAEMLNVGRLLRDCALDNSFPADMPMQHAIQAARAYAGMTLNEFADFVTRILIREADGFEGMTYAECFYLPMVEVVEYLQENGFTCYVCSGSDRFICRVFIEGMLDIPYNNVIGMDVQLEATEQGEEEGLNHTFSIGEDVVRTDKLLVKNLKTNKVLQIAQEIGQRPVLSFGNSSGDTSMHNYVIGNNPYRSMAFMLVADDDVRDYGNPEKGAALADKWAAAGYQVISMRDDWKTIYGEDVVKTGEFHWLEELAEDRVPVDAGEGTLGMANPWADMTKDELEQVSGVPFGVPDGAEEVVYRWLESEGLAEMQFTLDGDEYCARVKPAALEAGQLENISGMYYGWENEESVTIGHCEGTIGQYQTGSEEWVELCQWYDLAPGLMYSLSVYTVDPDGLDLTAVAEMVYVPTQGDAEPEGAELGTLGDYLDLGAENSSSNYSPTRYVYGYILDGVPVRVTAEMTEEIYNALWDLEFDDDYEQNFRVLIEDLPVVSVEDLSDEMISQEELDAFVGMKGEDVLAQGFEVNGYSYSDEETVFFMENGLFDYAFEFEEIIDDEEADPYELVNGMTVKAAWCSGIGYQAISAYDDSDYDYGEDLLSWFFGDLYSSVPRPVESPEWVTNLPQAQDESVAQLFVVAGMGMDKTTATVSLHMKDEDGKWMQILSTPGFVGKNGLCLDADHAEGCGQTPIGVYRFNKAFGIAADPGCQMEYIQVDEDIYWSGDENEHYNEMVNINDYPDLDMSNSEHIVDYDYEYQYCLNISFNEEGAPGRGSAIFLHCFGVKKPYTGGCMAIPENIMKLVMQAVNEDCVVVIDTVENLNVSF
ncbi:MAG: haloacid dehalogenase-like hydrolase [Clostridia bacterium]|nr:haloacid dehalogenase-like hydrolase [Clostridia bacterium]